MRKENILGNFEKVRSEYMRLKRILENQEFDEQDLFFLRRYAERIKINNSILTILDSYERLKLDELSEEESKTFLKDSLGIENLSLRKLRNNLAHSHYEVDESCGNIIFEEKGSETTITSQDLENLARVLLERLREETKSQKVNFDGIKLNDFIDDLINGKDDINIDLEAYSTLIQSYNIYNAFLYEKTLQFRDVTDFSSYYEKRMLLNKNLPYIRQNINRDRREKIEEFNFKNLTNQSKNDLLYFLMTSEYKEEALKSISPENPEDALKKIAVLYLYPSKEYKDFAISIFKTRDITESENAQKALLEYKEKFINNSTQKDFDKIIDFMIMKLPKMGRINNGTISPTMYDLLYGFGIEDNKKAYVYPSISELVKITSVEDLLKRYVNEDEKISKKFSELGITFQDLSDRLDLIFFLANKSGELSSNSNISENLKSFFEKLNIQIENTSEDSKSRIYGKATTGVSKSTKKELDVLLKNLPDKYKAEFIMIQMKEKFDNNDMLAAYKHGLFLLRMAPNNKNLLGIKRKIESDLLEKKEEFSEEDRKYIDELFELGKKMKLPENMKKDMNLEFVDFTELIKHIRDSSIHALTDVDYSSVNSSKRTLKVRKGKSLSEPVTELRNIRFNFQDYDSKTSETTFLLINLPVDKLHELVELEYEPVRRKEKTITEYSDR